MKSFTLDTNCIIDLANDRPRAALLRPLVVAWNTGLIDLAVVAISGSENQRGGAPNKDYSAFEELLEQAKLNGVTELLPPLVWDLAYWDHFTFIEELETAQLQALSTVLFPSLALPPPEAQANSKWRNQQCDVVLSWTHAKYQRDYFVTSDENFHRRISELVAFGVGKIIRPDAAAEVVRNIGETSRS